MPYLPQAVRDRLDGEFVFPMQHSGELNYAICRVCLHFLPIRPSYNDYNTVVGVLECVKLEIYRRMVARYEDRKRAENGDVFPEGGSKWQEE